MIIAYFTTRNLYPYILPSIMSLLDHNRPERIYIFAEDDRLPFELPEPCLVVNISDQKIFTQDSPNWTSPFSWIVMMRACIAKLIPGPRAIQLDIDTIITDSLEPIWEADLGENWIMAADEALGSFKPFGPKYYNCGVLVANLDQIRKDRIDDRIIQLLQKQRLNFVDQDAWNILGKGRIQDMPLRYNECFATGMTFNPAIVHYAGYREHWLPETPRFSYYEAYKKFERHPECD